MINISGKSPGQRRPLFKDWSISLNQLIDNQNSPIPFKNILSQIVTLEVTAFENRQHDQQMLRVLTEKQIQDQASQGKVDMGGREYNPQTVNREEVIKTALEAFQDGLFLTVIDEKEIKSLDEPVTITENSHITFIRLTLLIGG